jgi:nitrilase
MTEKKQHVKVAVVQAAPVLFDREATVEKACGLIEQAADQSAQLILFPEAFIPAYPRGLAFGTVVGSRSPVGRKVWQRYWENTVEVPGPTTFQLGEAAKKANVYLAMGVIERDAARSSGTVYCTLLYFGPDGRLLGKHQKLKPTGGERLIWGEGDGSTLTVIYLAPTADARDTWQATLRHIACEGRCFVLGCNQYMTKEMYPDDLKDLKELDEQPELMCRGGSVVISPLGKVLAGPLYEQEGILFADLDLGAIARSKFDFDVVGHYARPDVFQLTVNENPSISVVAVDKK